MEHLSMTTHNATLFVHSFSFWHAVLADRTVGREWGWAFWWVNDGFQTLPRCPALLPDSTALLLLRGTGHPHDLPVASVIIRSHVVCVFRDHLAGEGSYLIVGCEY